MYVYHDVFQSEFLLSFGEPRHLVQHRPVRVMVKIKNKARIRIRVRIRVRVGGSDRGGGRGRSRGRVKNSVRVRVIKVKENTDLSNFCPANPGLTARMSTRSIKDPDPVVSDSIL